MEQVNLSAKAREQLNKGEVKRRRFSGTIPAIVYRKGEKSRPLFLDVKEIEKALRTSAGENVLINLKVEDEDKKGRTCIVKEVQHNPLSGNIVHVDFNEISLTEAIKVNVPLVVVGEAVGVKQDGGVLEHILWEVEVECLPTQIPQKLEVDVSNLRIGDALFIKDISVPEGVKIINDPEIRIVAVEKHVELKAEEVAAEAAVTEPEVIKQKKEEEIVAEEAEKKSEKKKE